MSFLALSFRFLFFIIAGYSSNGGCNYGSRQFLKLSRGTYSKSIDLVTVLEAILMSRQSCEKLQCLYENVMLNNFHKIAVLRKI